jgi:hypothetical protein
MTVRPFGSVALIGTGSAPVAGGVSAVGASPVGGATVSPAAVAEDVAAGDSGSTGLPSWRMVGFGADPQPPVASNNAMMAAATFIGSPPPSG